MLSVLKELRQQEQMDRDSIMKEINEKKVSQWAVVNTWVYYYYCWCLYLLMSLLYSGYILLGQLCCKYKNEFLVYLRIPYNHTHFVCKIFLQSIFGTELTKKQKFGPTKLSTMLYYIHDSTRMCMCVMSFVCIFCTS